MKRLLYLIPILLFAACGNPPSEVLQLTNWQFEYQDEWHPATVPGCIHTDLLDNHLIPDPFVACNEDSLQWVSQRVWCYRTTFATESLVQADRCELVFDGLDTYAEIILNGRSIGRTDNMYRQWRFSINRYQLQRTNELLVRFYPVAQSDSLAALSFPAPVPDKRIFSRTAPYQQGWDWGPKLKTCGIWQQVRLVSYNGPLRKFIDPQLPPIEVSNPEFFNVELRQDTDAVGQSFAFYRNGEPFFVKGANWIPAHSFPVLNASLKDRYRYLLTSAKECGFNMIRLWGGGIYEHEYFYDLCDSLGILVWQDFVFNGSFYPSDSAFLSNCRLEAEQQVRRIARHPCVVLWCGNNEVKNAWEDWGWQQQFNYSPEQCALIEHSIDTLFGPDGILASVVAKYGQGRPYIPTTPLFGWGHPECVTHGPSHYWGVWWGELPFEAYYDKTGRFMTEFGFQSYPGVATVSRFFPEARVLQDLDTAASALARPEMRSHQKHARGVEIIDKAMMRYYGVDSKSLRFGDYLYVSQLLQAYGVSFGIESHLFHKGHCQGSLFWQLNDCWPVASWSSIDFYGNWKALQHHAKRLFGEVTVLSQPGSRPGEARVGVVTDLTDAQLQGSVLMTLYSFGGKVLGTKTVDARLDSRTLFETSYQLPSRVDSTHCVLLVQFLGIDGRPMAQKLHYFASPAHLRLRATDWRWGSNENVWDEGKRRTITIRNNGVLMKDVMLTTQPHIDGHFSDNFFDLLPGEEKVISFIPYNPRDPQLRLPVLVELRCLNDVITDTTPFEPPQRWHQRYRRR